LCVARNLFGAPDLWSPGTPPYRAVVEGGDQHADGMRDEVVGAGAAARFPEQHNSRQTWNYLHKQTKSCYHDTIRVMQAAKLLGGSGACGLPPPPHGGGGP